MIKIAMIRIDEELQLLSTKSTKKLEQEKLRSKMLLQVHDELVFEVPKDEIKTMEKLVLDKMTKAMKLDVPIEVEVDTGENWLEAH